MKTILSIVGTILGILFLQELPSYIGSKLFDTAIPSICKFVLDKYRSRYFLTLKSDSFRMFKNTVLKNYYSEDDFITVNGYEYPVCVFPYCGDSCSNRGASRDKWIRKYDSLINNRDTENLTVDVGAHKVYKHFRGYQSYHLIMSGKIRFPDRPCFMLKKLETNDSTEMTSLSVHIGTYGENAYSNHILEYELYKVYKKYRNVDIKKKWPAIEKSLYLRNAKHRAAPEYTTKQFLCNADNRYSMLGVQMLVLIRDGESYKVMIVQRSSTVAIAPEYYQLVPAGAFEVFADNTSEYAEHEVLDNLSPGAAVFREYIEEILGEPEYDGHGHGGVGEALFGDAHLHDIYKLLNEKKATFRFLGSVADLTYLRHLLSFLLVIVDPEYRINTQFRGNDEAKSSAFVNGITIDNFESVDKLWDNLYGPSAGMWALFKQLLDKDDELKAMLKTEQLIR